MRINKGSVVLSMIFSGLLLIVSNAAIAAEACDTDLCKARSHCIVPAVAGCHHAKCKCVVPPSPKSINKTVKH